MDRPETELQFDLSEQLFESTCAVNARRIRILTDVFLKISENFPEVKKLCEEEIYMLQELNKREIE